MSRDWPLTERAADRFDAIDRADPLPSWDGLAARAGLALTSSTPEDRFPEDYELMLWWPVGRVKTRLRWEAAA